MLTCMYQPPVSLGKTCLLKVNRETKKVIISKFTDKKGGQVNVELVRPFTRKCEGLNLCSKQRSFEEQDNETDSSSCCSGSDPDSDDSSSSLPETCGLSLSELEGMAARQARQLETQDQLLAAKAQRLRYLKSGGEAERLQRLRDKVATQEERLRKLRALRGKVHTNRNGNSVLSSDLESLRAVFNEKEKELSLAVAKVDELTRQLEDIRRGNNESSTGSTNPSISNGPSTAAIELDKLRRELMYRQKLREAQATRVAAQRAALSQRQDESTRVDRRIAELQERLHRKRLLNHQLAATLKHQENVEDFVVGIPNKNDPKYQTLPYNAKLFAPFATKQQMTNNHHHLSTDQEKFDKAVQQMQIITLDHHQQQQQQHQLPPGNNKMNNFTNNLQLHQLLSQNHHNTKSANNILTESHQQQSAGLPSQNNMSNGLHHLVKGKSWAALGEPNNGFPLVRPSNFLPTGAPSPVTDLNGLFNSQVGPTKDVTSSAGSNASVSESSCDGYSSNGNHAGHGDAASTKPALPPKPAKPAPPLRQASVLQDVFSYNQRSLSTGDGSGVMPDRTELPIKPKPLFLKTDREGNGLCGTNTLLASVGSAEKEANGNGPSNSTVRVSTNRRIEMPPAFLFPESDPPPSDLVPEHSSGGSVELGNGTGSRSSYSSGGSQDVVDASPLHRNNHHAKGGMPPGVEEYTLPDLFPQPPVLSNLSKDKDSCNSLPSTPPYATHPTNNIHHQNNNTKYYQPQQQLTDTNNSYSHHPAYNSNDLISSLHNSSSLTNNNIEMGMTLNGHHGSSHVSMMSIQVGHRDSPAAEDESSKHNAFIQPEPYEVGNENKSPSSEPPADREESSSCSSSSNTPSFEVNSNVPGPGSMSGVVRRVKKGNLKSNNKEQGSNGGRRVSFDPLALLLDASLEGELDLVMKTAGEVGNPSAANDEGITALHNAICAGHADVVRFLVEFGCDVNAQDSDGWTPLHCAASCNNVGMVKFLVERGACIFATTLSDHETAAQKCEEDEDGFGPCSEYLYSIQEKLGIINGGVVYGVFDYDQQNPDELNFQEGSRLTILRKGDEFEREWWWAGLEAEKQGYVPRNLLGLYPRVAPQKRISDES